MGDSSWSGEQPVPLNAMGRGRETRIPPVPPGWEKVCSKATSAVVSICGSVSFPWVPGTRCRVVKEQCGGSWEVRVLSACPQTLLLGVCMGRLLCLQSVAGVSAFRFALRSPSRSTA